MSIKLKRILLILSLGILVIYFPAVSQEIPDLDKLSDDQLKSFIQKAEEGGYTEDQLLLGAKARGMSDAQISKFRARINKIKAGGADKTGQKNEGKADSRLRKGYEKTNKQDNLFDPFESLSGQQIDTLPKIFGMDYFKNNQLGFEASVKTPEHINYVSNPNNGYITLSKAESKKASVSEIFGLNSALASLTLIINSLTQ